jgi:hypothetical protein
VVIVTLGHEFAVQNIAVDSIMELATEVQVSVSPDLRR